VRKSIKNPGNTRFFDDYGTLEMTTMYYKCGQNVGKPKGTRGRKWAVRHESPYVRRQRCYVILHNGSLPDPTCLN
jgi:hypothetical protein